MVCPKRFITIVIGKKPENIKNFSWVTRPDILRLYQIIPCINFACFLHSFCRHLAVVDHFVTLPKVLFYCKNNVYDRQ